MVACLAGWRTDWWGWQADYLDHPGDLFIWLVIWLVASMAIWLIGKLSGWQSDWIKGLSGCVAWLATWL